MRYGGSNITDKREEKKTKNPTEDDHPLTHGLVGRNIIVQLVPNLLSMTGRVSVFDIDTFYLHIRSSTFDRHIRSPSETREDTWRHVETRKSCTLGTPMFRSGLPVFDIDTFDLSRSIYHVRSLSETRGDTWRHVNHAH